MNSELWVDDALDELRANSLERSLTDYPQVGGKIRVAGQTLLNFSSNDYLNLSCHPAMVARSRDFLERYGCGATASRLVTGTLAIHRELEQTLACRKGYPQALVFGSGFLTNAGVIPALVGRGDHVFSDQLVHASLIDGIALSKATVHRFQHNDVEHLRSLLQSCPGSGRKLIVTESLFSMDGDLAPLPEIASLAMDFGAMLMVDEAHATGVFGPAGGGLIRHYGLMQSVNVSMGTLSKALGGYGGFIAGSAALCQLVVNRARAFIYTTGLPPAIIGGALGALQIIQEADTLGTRLLDNAAMFRKRLREAGLDTGNSESQIVPVLIGGNQEVLEVARRLREEGILSVAMRPPTVPPGTARLRLSVTLAHSVEDLQWAADRIVAVVREQAAR